MFIQHLKHTELRANKLLVSVQKGQQERKQIISANWTQLQTGLQGQLSRSALPQIAQIFTDQQSHKLVAHV